MVTQTILHFNLEKVAPALKVPFLLLREAEASGVSAFRTEKFGRRKR